MKKNILTFASMLLILLVFCIQLWANPIPPRWGRINNSAPARLDMKCANNGNGYLYLFGGRDTLGQMVNDIYRLSPNFGSNWTRLSAPGPEGRIGHGLGYTIGSNYLFLFGGKNQAGQYLNDAWVFNVVTGVWSKVDSTGPFPRAFCSLVYDQYSNGFVMFGGMNDDSLFGDTWEWNFVSGWRLLTTNGPSPRINAALVNTRYDNPLYLYGGRVGMNGEVLNDAWLLWDTLWIEGVLPDSQWIPPRTDFAAGAYEGRMLVSGGRDASNPDSILSDCWRIYQTYPDFHAFTMHLPSPLQNRYSAVAGQSYTSALIIGGTDGNQIFRDVWAFDIQTYVPGDVNNNRKFNGMDIVYLTNFWKGIGPPPPYYLECNGGNMLYATADADGSCSVDGLDITYLLNYIKGFGPAPLGCNQCPPSPY